MEKFTTAFSHLESPCGAQRKGQGTSARGFSAFLLITAFFIATLSGIASPATATAEQGRKPKVAIVSAADFSFGSVSEGSKVVHEFTISNSGSAELILQRIVPACGCTAVSATKDPLAPGAQTTIRAELDTAGFSGAQEKLIRVFTNDPETPLITLFMKGTVVPEVTIDPPRLVFPSVVAGSKSAPSSQEFTVRVRSGSQASIDSVSTLSPTLSVEEISSGEKERRVRVTLPTDLPSGELRERVIVTLANAPVTSVNVPIWASVKSPVMIRPANLSFGVIQGTKPIVKKLRVELTEPGKLVVRSARADQESLSVQVDEIKPGRAYALSVSLDPQKIATELRSSLTVTVEVNGEPARDYTVSVYGILPVNSR